MTADQTIYNQEEPVFIAEYTDPTEHFKGWLVINGLRHTLCAGGMRVQKGLTRDHMIEMARNMSLKMNVCGLPIDGAKCGIDYDPDAPGKKAAMTRFMHAIQSHIESSYSMGPDLNTDMEELEAIAHTLGIPSVKMAIAKAQGMSLPSFQERYHILQHEALHGWSLGRVRAGYGVAMAALATMRHLHIEPRNASVVVQGFGNLAKATIAALRLAGVPITAIADAKKCFANIPDNPDFFKSILEHPGTLLPSSPPAGAPATTTDKEAIYSLPCDILILAAVENVVSEKNAPLLQTKAIVPGANLAVTEEGEKLLFQRKIVTLPSFVAGCGGSLSMQGLFAPASPPTTAEVLHSIRRAMNSMIEEVLLCSEKEQITPTQAAFKICAEKKTRKGGKPYSNET